VCGDAHAVLEGAAADVAAMVGVGGEELVDEVPVRPVDLHAVGAGALGAPGGLDEQGDHVGDLRGRHLAHGLAHGDVLDRRGRGHGLVAVEEGDALAAGMVDLHDELAAVGVDAIDQARQSLDVALVGEGHAAVIGASVLPVDGGALRDDQADPARGARSEALRAFAVQLARDQDPALLVPPGDDPFAGARADGDPSFAEAREQLEDPDIGMLSTVRVGPWEPGG
jgi:hypothetical protein